MVSVKTLHPEGGEAESETRSHPGYRDLLAHCNTSYVQKIHWTSEKSVACCDWRRGGGNRVLRQSSVQCIKQNFGDWAGVFNLFIPSSFINSYKLTGNMHFMPMGHEMHVPCKFVGVHGGNIPWPWTMSPGENPAMALWGQSLLRMHGCVHCKS